LISTINTQLFNLKIFTLAKLNKWSDGDIVNKLLFNQFTILSFNGLRTNINKINELISELWQLEYNMKHNNINQYLGFKFFLSK
jgi:DNA polymerase III delta subunit